jgi:hypothetical protein
MGQRFQSFWWGDPLSPYEWLCLKSFADFGHGVDLYTFDPDLAVPSKIRVCDASEIADRSELFVYEDGFGKGSPAAFANIFRYKLLALKGGWWIDTDVVCLTEQIPDWPEFLAHQDGDFVNNAVMLFPPHHPVMTRCLEASLDMGRSARWGDAGPRLLTLVLRDLRQMGRVLPASVCYPVHFSDALDLLRPSKLGSVAARLGGSVFLHLWNQILMDSGIRKTYLPPKGSMLRHLVEQHQVRGWTGEYDESALADVQQAHADLLTVLAAQRKLETELDAMVRSRSWRLTKPLRVLSGYMSSARRPG